MNEDLICYPLVDDERGFVYELEDGMRIKLNLKVVSVVLHRKNQKTTFSAKFQHPHFENRDDYIPELSNKKNLKHKLVEIPDTLIEFTNNVQIDFKIRSIQFDRIYKDGKVHHQISGIQWKFELNEK